VQWRPKGRGKTKERERGGYTLSQRQIGRSEKTGHLVGGAGKGKQKGRYSGVEWVRREVSNWGKDERKKEARAQAIVQ